MPILTFTFKEFEEAAMRNLSLTYPNISKPYYMVKDLNTGENRTAYDIPSHVELTLKETK